MWVFANPTTSPERRFRNDCSVIAVQQITGISYEAAIRACSEWGRSGKNGCMRDDSIIAMMKEEFGFNYKYLPYFDHPLKNIIGDLPKTGAYMIFVPGHVMAFVNGVLYDAHAMRWVYRTRKVKGIVKLTRVEQRGG